MADPLSLAASVAGLVSLGLQVTSGITKYLDAVKCRDEELSEIRRQNGLLKDTLGVIEKTATQLDQVPPDVAAATQRIIESHHDSLNKLETLIAQLASSDVGTWRARLKDKAGKLHYAFDRPKLQELCHQATQTQSALQLALEGLGKALRKIARLLATGKTSPLAVNYCNQSLMHVAFGIYNFGGNNYPLADLVQTLVLHGVPPISYDIWGKDHDEVDEIQEEESGTIKVLEDMVAEFQDMIASISGDSALSQFQACWACYWTDRVPVILEELNDHRMTQTERQDAKLIGVVWESESDESEDATGNPYDSDTIDYWHYKLDSITEDA
ncbi:hypothetical protein PG985_003318 [Apiospora marii]|uniref:uncharacterized protein n=1 Tax=Apiospora marii TaxID=335849 RepID=UPI003131C29E